MNAQQLKNAILQEAIEGRLVPQDLNDEPASALLARIRKEKEQLVKAGKLKKKDLEVKPISEDEIPFEIPGSWEWVRLSDVMDVRDGTHDTPAYIPHGYPLITGKDFYNGYFDLSKTQYISECDYIEICKRSKVDIGDILFSMIGGNIGSQILISKDNYFEMAIKNVALFKQFPSKCVDSKYLSLFLEARVDHIKSIALGGAQSFVSLNLLRPYLFPLPPLAEQKRIVAKIEELLPKVDEYGKAQDALNKLNAELPERLKKSILQEAIEGRLVPQDPNDEPASVLLAQIRKEKEQLVKEGKLKKKDLIETPISDDEIPFEIPDSWEWCRIKQLFETTSGGTPEKGHPEYYGGEIPWVKVGDLIKKNIDKTEECISEEGLNHSSAKLFPKGTILVAMYCNDAIGKSSIIESPMTTNQAICGLFPNPSVSTDYIYYAIQANRTELQEKAAGGAQKNINQKIVNDMLIPLPPLVEQHRIVEKLEQLLGEIDKLKN